MKPISLAILPVCFLLFANTISAQITAVKMNMLYIGVPNPITISCTNGKDIKDLSIMANNSGLIKYIGPGLYEVNITQPGVCEIIERYNDPTKGPVTIAAKSFRVKYVPAATPTLSNGKEGGTISAEDLENCTHLMTILRDFEFDVRSVITSFSLLKIDASGKKAAVYQYRLYV